VIHITEIKEGEMRQSEKNFLEKIADAIPGLSGYREKENRRTTDKRLREYLATRMDNARKKLSDLKLTLTNQGRLSELGDIGHLENRLTKLADSIRYASYGYSGMFDQLKIRDEELDLLYQHDLTFVAVLEELEKSVETDGTGLKDIVAKIDDLVEERKKLFEAPTVEGR
jgi:hypothetical protein